jgi:hypothetical protein
LALGFGEGHKKKGARNSQHYDFFHITNFICT